MDLDEQLIEPWLKELDQPVKDYLVMSIRSVLKDNDDPKEWQYFVEPILKSCGWSPEKFSTFNALLHERYFDLLDKIVMETEVVPFESPIQMSASRLVTDPLLNKTGKKSVSLDWLASKRTGPSHVDRAKLEKIEARHKQRRDKRLGITSSGIVDEKELTMTTPKEDIQAELDAAQLEDILLHGLQGAPRQDIQIADFDIALASKRILTNATLSLSYGRIYGLVGRNGIGKSTLLRALARRDLPHLLSNLSILHVEQETTGDDTPVIEAVLLSDRRRHLLMREEDLLMKKDNPSEDEHQRLRRVQHLLQDLNADAATALAAVILSGLGFSASDQHRPTREFSGGWRMRIALASALFCQPDLLLLDEPTNMLDIPAVAWLEDHLVSKWTGTVMVVSHDRAFLNNVATDILHLHNEQLDAYRGNYEQFVVTREERFKNAQREYDNQLAYRQQLQSFIDRWRCNANRASQAQSRLKILEKLPDLPPPVITEPPVVFKFSTLSEALPSPVLSLEDVSFSYDNNDTGNAKLVLRNVDLAVEAQDRMAIVGPNGAGKTTLLKLLTGQLEPTRGVARQNSRIRIGYFSQHHVDQLDLPSTPLEMMSRKFPGTDEEHRRFLGAFGLVGPLALQRIGTLSGGQKSRVVMAWLAAQQPHVLVLDEPTNHLDMDSIDALIKACQNFSGAIIAVSHDQRFISSLCDNNIWVCANGTVTKYRGPDGIKGYIQELKVY